MRILSLSIVPLAQLDLLRRESDADELLTTAACIRGLARRVPWRADCLPQSMALIMLMSPSHLQSSRLVLGVSREARSSADTDMEAHAWVEWQGLVVLGLEGQSRFLPVVALMRSPT
jgi:hypothetical protein